MSIKRIRNENFQPNIEDEGFFNGPGLVVPPTEGADEKSWCENLKIYQRLYHHNTLSSARRHANFVNCRFAEQSNKIDSIAQNFSLFQIAKRFTRRCVEQRI
jgi:hypothetical protein